LRYNLQDKFKLTFTKPNRFSASTDCNGVGGEYIVTGNKIVFDKMMSTLMYCDNSQEGEFSKALGEVSSFHFTGKGELVLDLKYDSGSMLFK
jgi:heat shock protein HslJ